MNTPHHSIRYGESLSNLHYCGNHLVPLSSSSSTPVQTCPNSRGTGPRSPCHFRLSISPRRLLRKYVRLTYTIILSIVSNWYSIRLILNTIKRLNTITAIMNDSHCNYGVSQYLNIYYSFIFSFSVVFNIKIHWKCRPFKLLL